MNANKEEHKLHHLLGTVLSDRLPIETKYEVLGRYGIPIESEIKTEVEEMSGLGHGIWEEAWGEAWEKAGQKARMQAQKEQRNNVLRLNSFGWPDEQIAVAYNITPGQVHAIITAEKSGSPVSEQEPQKEG